MRHPYYSGRKAEKVPSVGSRLAGVVKPSYGKPKLTLESNPLKLTGDSRGFGFNPLGPSDIDAKNPRRLTRDLKAFYADLAQRARHAHRTNKRFAKNKPRLIKH